MSSFVLPGNSWVLVGNFFITFLFLLKEKESAKGGSSEFDAELSDGGRFPRTNSHLGEFLFGGL
jgi:hypothetical protein